MFVVYSYDNTKHINIRSIFVFARIYNENHKNYSIFRHTPTRLAFQTYKYKV